MQFQMIALQQNWPFAAFSKRHIANFAAIKWYYFDYAEILTPYLAFRGKLTAQLNSTANCATKRCRRCELSKH